MEKSELINAQEMARLHPKTFKTPILEDFNSIKPGTYLKVCAEPERFWVEVIEVVDNELLYSHIHGYQYKDIIKVNVENIYRVENNFN